MTSSSLQTKSKSKNGVELSVSGMTCGNCARHVREALLNVAGVASAEVSMEQGLARVEWKPDAAPIPPALVKAVQAAGYQAKIKPQETPKKTAFSSWGWNIVLGLACTLPIMIGEWVFGLAMERWFQWTAFALALPVQILCGARFYKGAWSQ